MFRAFISFASRYRSAAYVLGAVLAFMWAAQHPFTSMFYREIARSHNGILEALLVTEIMYIVLYSLVLLTSEGRRGIVAVRRVDKWLPAITQSALFAILALSLYIASQGKFSPTQLGFVLNASPISSLLVALVISKKVPKKRPILFNAIFMTVVVTITFIGEGGEFFTSVPPVHWLLAAMVPMFYFASTQTLATKFHGNNSALLGAIIIANVGSSVVFALLIGSYLVYIGHIFSILNVDIVTVILFFLGTALSSVLVRIILHVLLEVEGGSVDKASVMYNLTPVFTFIISYIVFVGVGTQYLSPKGYEVYILMFFIPIYSVLYIVTKMEAKQLKSS